MTFLARLWRLLNTPIMSRFATRHELLLLERKLMATNSALSDRIDALTTAVSQVATDTASVVSEVADLQAKAAEGNATPEELANLDALAGKLKSIHATLSGVLPAPTPTESPATDTHA